MGIRKSRYLALIIVLIIGLGWFFQSRSTAQETGRGCSAPASWGELRGGAALLSGAGYLTFEDKGGTIRIAKLEAKGSCQLFLTVTRE
jgi:hypothetical protein